MKQPKSVKTESNQQLIEQFLDIAEARLRSRLEEVLGDPDSFGGGNPSELRWQVCGAFADDLQHGLADLLEELLAELSAVGGLPEPKV